MYIMDYMPFTYHRANEGQRVDFKQIFQALIVAAVTGLAVMYGTQNVIKAELRSIHDDIEEIKMNQSEFRRDFYQPRH